MTKKKPLVLKDGDIVLIKILYVDNENTKGNPEYRLSGDDPDFFMSYNVSDEDIHSILESPLRVGDKVDLKNGYNSSRYVDGTIIAFNKDKSTAWVEWNLLPDGLYHTKTLKKSL